MKYVNGFLILLLLYVSYITARSIARNNKIEASNKKSFRETEAQANSVRKADISNLDFITIPTNSLPLDTACEQGCETQITALKNLSGKKIIDLSSYTNTELKLMYGPANLDTLCQYDNNYTELIRILNKIGGILMENNNPDTAKVFLEYAISIGSDISDTYKNLGTIYISENDTDSFEKLIKTAEALCSLSKSTILTKLNNIKSSDK